MKLEINQVTKLRLTELEALDPVGVVLEDMGPRQGKITIDCYGKAWSSYFGGMGNNMIAEFVVSCDDCYLAEKFSSMRSHIPDYDKVQKLIRKEVCKLRRGRELDRNHARDFFKDAGYIVEESDAWVRTDLMQLALGEEWYRDVPEKENPDHAYLRRIIRAAQAGIREYLAMQPKVAA